MIPLDEFNQLELVSPLPFEFGSCLPKCSDLDIHPLLLKKLEDMYRLYPFTLKSGYRCRSYERNAGRSGRSKHCFVDIYGKPSSLAADILVRDDRERAAVLYAAVRCCFPIIGFHPDSIHVEITDNVAGCDFSSFVGSD